MKTKTLTALAASGLVYLLSAGNVFAAFTIIGGASCHHLIARKVGDIEYYLHGLTNAGNSVTSVICPIEKKANDYKGVKVRINLDSKGPKTVTCTLYSRNPNGTPIVSKTVQNAGTGKEALLVSVASSTPRSYFSLICDLPGKEVSEIFSVETLN